MTRTINGKPIPEIITALQADFPEEDIENRDYDNVPYISVDAYRKRLNDVVGIDHYTETYDNVELVKAGETYAVKTMCHLTLLDDEYVSIFTKDSSGGSIIAFPKVDKLNADGKPCKDAENKTIKIPGNVTNSLPNDFDSACQDAFKRICKKQFNMGKEQLKRKSKGTVYTVKIIDIREYNGSYYGNMYLQPDNKKIKLAVFKNTVNEFLKICGGAAPKKDDVISFIGKEGKDRNENEQIIFVKSSGTKMSSPVSAVDNKAATEKATASANASSSTTSKNKPAANVPIENAPTPACSCIDVKTTSLLTGYGKNGNKCIKTITKDNKEMVFILLPEDANSIGDFADQFAKAQNIICKISYVTIKDKFFIKKVS